jgi:hypothetical protein
MYVARQSIVNFLPLMLCCGQDHVFGVRMLNKHLIRSNIWDFVVYDGNEVAECKQDQANPA